MWQTLETKARFIHQVTRGETSVRAAEDLESGALTYAEIKAIASGNPAVVEKIKIDTEIRKLDQLRAVHANQQRHIRWEIRDLPRQIAEAKQHLAHILSSSITRVVDRHGALMNSIEVRFIEVKGRSALGEVALTTNEYKTAERLKTDFWLYVVFNCASKAEIRIVQDPARLNWEPLVKIEHYHVGPQVILEASR
jgi:hypothetical protein